MTNIPDNINEINSKLKELADLMSDLLEKSPTVLRNFLEDYRVFLNEGDGINVLHSSSSVKNSTADVSCQTEFITESNPWNLDSITEDVTCIAEKVTLETGLSYDESSGWYYDHKMKCYYNANHRLYYYNEHNAYYYYDEESKGLKFYCSLSSQTNTNLASGTGNPNKTIEADQQDNLNEKIQKIKKNQALNVDEIKNSKGNELLEDKEDGECSDSDGDHHIGINSIIQPVVIEAKPTVFEPGNTKHFAPCIRVIVKSSALPTLCNGTLFIVTCTGGTIGREGDHDVLIPDHLVSKMHSKFQYVFKDGLYFYELIDLGSKNGTYVNGKRLSDTLVQSDPITITHGSIITVGHTDLLCHIHPYDETCSECVPFNNISQGNSKSSENGVSLKDKYNLEASLIKKKFGIDKYYIAKHPEGYEDRADIRRKLVGSSHHSEKTETASMNEPLSKKNKGYKLLSKMGWKEGDTLGKRNEGAALEPVHCGEGNNKKLGLGFESLTYGVDES